MKNTIYAISNELMTGSGTKVYIYTGKLPVSMLYRRLQRQTWNRVYDPDKGRLSSGRGLAEQSPTFLKVGGGLTDWSVQLICCAMDRQIVA